MRPDVARRPRDTARSRLLAALASALLLGAGFLMIAFGGTGLHDRMAGTRVMRRGEGI